MAEAQEQQPPRLQIQGQFIRDMSFENLAVRRETPETEQPEISIQVNLDAKQRQAPNTYQVIIKIQMEAKSQSSGEPVFILEIEYGGHFLIENVPEEQMLPFLLIECPRQLFPFLRRIVADVTSDGGFPPLNLETIDFVRLYQQEIARRQAEAGQQTVN